MLTISKIVIALLVGLGAVYTVWDWHNWKVAESAKFGQGPQEVATPAQPLGKPVQSEDLGLRISPPLGWEVSAADVIRFSSGSARIEVWVEERQEDLTVVIDNRVKDLPPSVSDRQYASGQNVNLTILTWKEGEDTHQVALAKNQDRLVNIKSVAPTASWPSQASTFWTVYQSLVLF